MRLEFHPEAELELIEAAVHYELQVPGLGRRLEAEIRRATDLLLQHPEIGPPADPDLRKFVLGRFPFTLIYSVTPDVLRIEVVAHQSRLPKARIPMADDRYIRWQGLGIAQLTVAVALISSLSVAGLGVGLSLLLNEKFMPIALFKCTFAWSLLLLLLAALFSCGAVITRLLDFRLTARKVRKDKNPNYEKALTMFWLGPDAYSCATWGLFWSSYISFTLGIVLLVVSIGATYADRLH